MIFTFKVVCRMTLPSFSRLDFQTLVTQRFWVKKEEHNYKQIVYYKKNEELIPIINDKDLGIFDGNYDIDLFLAFIPKQNFKSIDEAIKHAAPYHKGKSCAACGIEPIIGRLYKCFECLDLVYLCEICEADKNHSHHLMLSVKTSRIIATTIPVEQGSAIHCDGCGVEPIIGFRYKCLLCYNRNFCEYCNAHTQLQCEDHGLVRIPDSGGKTAAGTVVSQANVPPVEDKQLKILNNKMDKMMEVLTLMQKKVLNIDGSAGKANEESHQQEDETDESKDRSVYKAD